MNGEWRWWREENDSPTQSRCPQGFFLGIRTAPVSVILSYWKCLYFVTQVSVSSYPGTRSVHTGPGRWLRQTRLVPRPKTGPIHPDRTPHPYSRTSVIQRPFNVRSRILVHLRILFSRKSLERRSPWHPLSNLHVVNNVTKRLHSRTGYPIPSSSFRLPEVPCTSSLGPVPPLYRCHGNPKTGYIDPRTRTTTENTLHPSCRYFFLPKVKLNPVQLNFPETLSLKHYGRPLYVNVRTRPRLHS